MAGLKHLLQRIWTGGGESRATLGNPDSTLMDALSGGYNTAAGVPVTPESAMRLSTVSACVRLISESIGSLPLHVYQRTDERTRTKITGTPQYRLLHDEPNKMMTAFVFRETMAAHVLVWGNAYALIIRNRAGEPIELLPVNPQSVRISKEPTTGELAYDVSLAYDEFIGLQKVYRVNQADILHVPGLAFNGVTGISPIKYAAQSIGLALAAERYGAAFFGNGSIPAGVLEIAGKPNAEQQKAIAASWNAAYGGSGNSGKTAVLVDGAKFSKISISPNEAQFIETRKMQIGEIARWYRVPPHMIGDLDKATFSNIEHQALEFVTHTLRPWLVRFEQEFNRKLFPSSSDGQPNDTYAEFNVDGLLRGDIKARGDYYVRGRQWGWLSANDIRGKENMEPIEGGDVYLTPMNMVDAANIPAIDQPADQGQTA
jgi:HK97 family phage portal protein